MDLIEILWKQDVDMGVSLDGWEQNNQTETATSKVKTDDLDGDCRNETADKDEGFDAESDTKNPENDQWAGRKYTIDLETGEYILKEDQSSTSSADFDEDEPPSSLLPVPETDFSLEEALGLVGLNDGLEELLERAEGGEDDGKDLLDDAAVNELEAATNQLQQELDIIAGMIQAPPSFHPRPYQRKDAKLQSQDSRLKVHVSALESLDSTLQIHDLTWKIHDSRPWIHDSEVWIFELRGKSRDCRGTTQDSRGETSADPRLDCVESRIETADSWLEIEDS
ncbi:Hypothetical protein NTJ_11765 [Nesidiocoris tenuis]|uniref:Uncharacterized protein n=1 Tax=Nesidiocoris tenuis TaxID=355587 RepID=A0ABN7B3G4_9HEMI|nr:Hypothetical protein NTJ_11765 [Nesidiocoris tenuis]